MLELLRTTLHEYGAGIAITQVKMQAVDPPGAVIDLFGDVQPAETVSIQLGGF